MSESKKNKKYLSLFLGVTVSVGILGFLGFHLDWKTLFIEFKKVNFLYLPLIALVIAASYFIRALRWKLLLPEGDKFSLKELYSATAIGLMASMIIPFRAGEFVRPWLLSKKGKTNFSAALASIIVERIFDILGVFALLGLFLTQLETIPPIVKLGAQALSLIALTLTVAIITAYLKQDLIIDLGYKLSDLLFGKISPSLAEKVKELGKEFVLGLQTISSLSKLLMVLIWSALLWGGYSLAYQAGVWAMGESPTLWVGVGLNVIIALAVAAPSAPGFVGTYQLGAVVALSGVYKFSEEFATAFSLIMHTMELLVIVLIGYFFLSLEGYAFADLKRNNNDVSTLEVQEDLG